MSLGKTNVTSNTVLAGHVDNFKSQMAEVLVIINILVICFIIRWSTFRRTLPATGQLWSRFSIATISVYSYTIIKINVTDFNATIVIITAKTILICYSCN